MATNDCAIAQFEKQNIPGKHDKRFSVLQKQYMANFRECCKNNQKAFS